MKYLKQSTAATVVLGPFVDSTDGVTAETALTISQADIRLSKNGGAFAQTSNAAGATHGENGNYLVPLDTTDTGTIGRLRVHVAESGALPVWEDFHVLHANVYDWLFGTAAPNTTTPPTAAAIRGEIDSNSTQLAAIVADTNELQGDWVNGGRLDLILDARASQTSVDTIDDLLDTEIAAIQTALTTIDTVVDSILVDTAEIGATGAGLTALATQASVNTIDDFLDTEIAAIKAKTDNLPASPANEATLTTIAGYIDTEIGTLTTNLATVDTVVDAIKAKTDNLPAAPAATGDIPTAIQNADAVLNRGASNVEGTADRHSLGAMVMIGTNSSISGTTLTAKKPSDDTTFATYTLTAAAGADPIGGIA